MNRTSIFCWLVRPLAQRRAPSEAVNTCAVSCDPGADFEISPAAVAGGYSLCPGVRLGRLVKHVHLWFCYRCFPGENLCLSHSGLSGTSDPKGNRREGIFTVLTTSASVTVLAFAQTSLSACPSWVTTGAGTGMACIANAPIGESATAGVKSAAHLGLPKSGGFAGSHPCHAGQHEPMRWPERRLRPLPEANCRFASKKAAPRIWALSESRNSPDGLLADSAPCQGRCLTRVAFGDEHRTDQLLRPFASPIP